MSKSVKSTVSTKTSKFAKFAAASTALYGGLMQAARAAEGTIDSELLGTFGCSIYNFLTGPLAVWAFILVVVGTLLIGLVAKIDFSKIIVVIVIFALIQGIGTWVMGVESVASKLGTASCLSDAG